MTIGFVFWLLMLLWLIFGLWLSWPAGSSSDPRTFWPLGSNLFLWVLLFLLGWKVFGFPIQG